MINIQQVNDKKALKKFIDFPHDLYQGDEYYVPELYIAQKELFDKKNHPFFVHSNLELFLAYRDNKIVGRIAAIRNNNHIEYTDQQAGHFGFFESIEDQEVANTLLDTAAAWIKDQGLSMMLGPANPSTNETCGTLVEGFDSSPTIKITYNKPYYDAMFHSYGMSKDMDLLSYIIYTKDVPERLSLLSSRILQRLNNKGITIRKVNLKKFSDEVDKLYHVYNKAWEKNWGFVPMTEAEFKHAAKDMKLAVDPDFLLIAEKNNEAIGFSLSLPDLNVPLKYVKRGRLFPFGLFNLLYHKKNIDRVRVITLGVVEGCRKLGIDAYFYMKAFEEAKNKKLLFGEGSWILENNEMMNKALQNINGTVYKRHRLYKINL